MLSEKSLSQWFRAFQFSYLVSQWGKQCLCGGVETGQTDLMLRRDRAELLVATPHRNTQTWSEHANLVFQNRGFPCIGFIMFHCFPALQILQIITDSTRSSPSQKRALLLQMWAWFIPSCDGLALKQFKWITDGSPDKWRGEGSPSLRPTSELPPEAAAQTHTMGRGRTQIWQPKLQR